MRFLQTISEDDDLIGDYINEPRRARQTDHHAGVIGLLLLLPLRRRHRRRADNRTIIDDHRRHARRIQKLVKAEAELLLSSNALLIFRSQRTSLRTSTFRCCKAPLQEGLSSVHPCVGRFVHLSIHSSIHLSVHRSIMLPLLEMFQSSLCFVSSLVQ